MANDEVMEAGSVLKRLPLFRGRAAAGGRVAGNPAAAAPVAGELRCAGCERTPLVGEWATLRRGGRGEAWLCALCENDERRAARLGAAVRRERLRSAAGARNVRRIAA